MSAAQLERLQEHLQRLRLCKSRERLEALLQEATAKEVSYADFLDQVLTEEVAAKTAKHVTMRTQLARFPFVKSLESFDFTYQPSNRGNPSPLSPFIPPPWAPPSWGKPGLRGGIEDMDTLLTVKDAARRA